MEKTIVAIASPVGTGAVSLIRLSGPDAFGIASAALAKGNLPSCRMVGLRKVRDAQGRALDEGVMVS
ncbi:MAG: tRNA modification GTPase, partial [Akkermansiaceae bacterium]